MSDFTDAARAEAEHAWYQSDLVGEGDPVADLGQHMAEWARDHLPQQEVTDAEVEAALNAHMNAATGDRDLPLDAYGALDIEAMRAALTAARTVGGL